MSQTAYFGAIVGNMVTSAKGKFALNNQAYFLTTNDNENHLPEVSKDLIKSYGKHK